jgi:hypothetical protein
VRGTGTWCISDSRNTPSRSQQGSKGAEPGVQGYMANMLQLSILERLGINPKPVILDVLVMLDIQAHTRTCCHAVRS